MGAQGRNRLLLTEGGEPVFKGNIQVSNQKKKKKANNNLSQEETPTIWHFQELEENGRVGAGLGMQISDRCARHNSSCESFQAWLPGRGSKHGEVALP